MISQFSRTQYRNFEKYSKDTSTMISDNWHLNMQMHLTPKFGLYRKHPHVILFEILGACLKCYSCDSRNYDFCHDPFVTIYNESAHTVVDCAEELSTHDIVHYISNLLNSLGIPATVNDKNMNQLRDGNEPLGCRKAEFDGKLPNVAFDEISTDMFSSYFFSHSFP